jgi:ABC-type Na+ efflux pump permease subunit
MAIWTLARKDLRLLLRDRRAVIVLLAMPFIFILVLGLSLGEGFGQKPDNRLRISLLALDAGHEDPAAAKAFPYAGLSTWAAVVKNDLVNSAGIRVEDYGGEPSLAERQVADGRRAAVLIFGPHFSERVDRCSFLKKGINPFYRDGIRLRVREAGQASAPLEPEDLDVELLIDPTQRTAAAIIEQVAQVSLLRVVLPWMIGRAFEHVGHQLGPFVQKGIEGMFPKFNLMGKTWESLTRSEPRASGHSDAAVYVEDAGSGFLRRGAANYQRLVPSYAVMFAFFLVLTVGWLFVGERHQGTLKRLRAAPLSRGQILLGKTLPCFALSLGQGLFLLGAGKLVFAMSWGMDPLWLLVVVFATSMAATGLALLVAALARTETQVAIYGTLLVLVLAGVSGCLMGDRELMPELMQRLSLLTPHAWALDAYKQLLTTAAPNLAAVAKACAVLAGFGAGFIVLAWWLLRLD